MAVAVAVVEGRKERRSNSVTGRTEREKIGCGLMVVGLFGRG